jgi:hypothetical protein
MKEKQNSIPLKVKIKGIFNKFSLTKSHLYFLILLIILISIIQSINSQNDFENLQNIDQIQREMYRDEGNHIGGGAHPGYQRNDYNEMNTNRMHQNRGGGNRHQMGGHGRHNQHGGGMGGSQHFNGNQDNIITNHNNRSYGPFGIFSNSWMNSLYEIMMMLFFLSFIYNCFCGNNKNDKYALAWYNANKQYFEERYSDIGLKEEKDSDGIQDINTTSLPIIKESQYVYKFYASGYRYIKWIMVVLEFRKRQDMFSLFTKMLFNNKDRIIYEVGIETLIEDSGWVFCICNKRDGPTLARDYQDINFFCTATEPSIMSDKLILYSESDELYCDLFKNRVINKFIFLIF